VRRELQHLLQAANEQHVHQHLGYKTPAQFRRGKRLRKLPANCTLPAEKQPIAVGKVIFIRWVQPHGRVDVWGESVLIGRRRRFQHVKLVLNTRSQTLGIYHNGRLLKHMAFKLRLS
jgi:hypothetical protein